MEFRKKLKGNLSKFREFNYYIACSGIVVIIDTISHSNETIKRIFPWHVGYACMSLTTLYQTPYTGLPNSNYCIAALSSYVCVCAETNCRVCYDCEENWGKLFDFSVYTLRYADVYSYVVDRYTYSDVEQMPVCEMKYRKIQ